jgi:adenosylhomocysteine nucleosidase
LFVATSSEEEALKDAARGRGYPFERIHDKFLGRYYWLGKIGNERVIAVRAKGMGPLGRGGSTDLALRFRRLTAASAIVQVGMAFGVAPQTQKYGDVLVSTSLIPYDNRDVRPGSTWSRITRRLGFGGPGYVVDYARASRQEASPVLISLFQREKEREQHSYRVHVGALLSGAARIDTAVFRDELLRSVPGGHDPIVGGEMEGVGLLAAGDEPIWCVVKGILDFAAGDRDRVKEKNRPIACRNAAEFVLSALVNDQKK